MTDPIHADDALALFHPWVSEWFRGRHGAPTEPQIRAWPLIHQSKNVLIHSPTGSGKTLAAFMSALDALCTRDESRRDKGVRTLYISPLKALNYDVERNLQEPLQGIAKSADLAGSEMPAVRVDVRTGDTPSSARARMLRRPPHILITTPESLYLMLTSKRAREILETVGNVIIDEIHTVSGNKRGVHLTLSLERLEQLAPGFQRIGLSATQRPLSEIAAFLGGYSTKPGKAIHSESDDDVELIPRSVEIVDCPGSKQIKVQVMGMPETDTDTAAGAIWPQLIPKVLNDIEDHNTTLVFTNSRRQAENTADRLNSALAARETGEEDIASAVGSGERGSGVQDGPFMAHHGSLSETMRRDIESRLKLGELPALVGTSSLELGIDIGSIDLVVQLQSPKTVTQGLQRIGRAGHDVGAVSEGKIYATHAEDLIESTVVAKGMMQRQVEEVLPPRNSLDVLAQQIVAAVAVEDWHLRDLYGVIKRAYPYAELRYSSFESVVRLVSGHYPRELFSSLRARVHWDRTRNILQALPGTRVAAIGDGGAIVDRGEFPVYLPDRKTRIGELDEEFVYESGEGDPFVLGSQMWRVTKIDDDRVLAEPAPGTAPRMPFWRGDFPWRPLALSKRLARFKSELAKRIRPHLEDDADPPAVVQWLKREYPIDDVAVRQLIEYIRQQLQWGDAVASDETIIVETYRDAIGDRRLVIHSPFGGRINGPWSVALARELEARTKIEPETQVSDDGIMFRLAEAEAEIPVEVVTDMAPSEVKDSVMEGMIDSALFGAVFRKNASRALLLPSPGNWQRTPFWLQRLRAKDLLAVARAFPDFPIMLESYRDALEDVMDMHGLEEMLESIQSGRIEVKQVSSKIPSPVARGLDFYFMDHFMYQWDMPKAERDLQALRLDRAALADLFRNPEAAGLLRPEAVSDISSRANRTAFGIAARSQAELAQIIEELGELSEHEIDERSDARWTVWLAELAQQGRVRRLDFGSPGEPAFRWVSSNLYSEYRAAISDPHDFQSVRRIVARYLARSGPVPLVVLESRYPVPSETLRDALDEMLRDEAAARGYFSDSGEEEWMDLAMLARIQERTLAVLRSEVEPTHPMRYQWELLRLQRLNRNERSDPKPALKATLKQMQGIAVSPKLWMRDILPSRVDGFRAAMIAEVIHDGEFRWVFKGDGERENPELLIIEAGKGRSFLPEHTMHKIESDPSDLHSNSQQIYEFILAEGIVTTENIIRGNSNLTLGEAAESIRELALGGLITSDSWNAAIAIATAPRQQRSYSNVSKTRVSHGPAGSGRYRARGHRREFAARIRQRSNIMPQDAQWSATKRFGFIGPEISEEEKAGSRARILLQRHGVVTRRALSQDRLDWDWNSIYHSLSLMELRGHARRGYFVNHLPGVQFAAPDFVERIRGDLHASKSDESETLSIAVSTLDPAFIIDSKLLRVIDPAVAEQLSINRIAGASVVLSSSELLLASQSNGAKLSVKNENDPMVKEALASLIKYLKRGSALRRIQVGEWNGVPVLQSQGAETLSKLGFRRDYPYLVMDFISASATQSYASPIR